MWWDSWEMWGRGRFRRKRKNHHQKCERFVKRKSGLYESDTQYYIMADPVKLNPLFSNPRTIKKVFTRVIQPRTPSPDEDAAPEADAELSGNEEVEEVTVSRPYRKGGPSYLHRGPKQVFGLTPLPEASHENTPSPSGMSRSSSNLSLPRKMTFSINAFVTPSDIRLHEDTPEKPPPRPRTRSPVLAAQDDKRREVEAKVPEVVIEEPEPEDKPSPKKSKKSSKKPPKSPKSPVHSPAKMPKVTSGAGPSRPRKPDLEEQQAGPSGEPRRPVQAGTSGVRTSLEPPSPHHSDSDSDSPMPWPSHSPPSKNKKLSKHKTGRKAPFPYPGAPDSSSEDELSPERIGERPADFDIFNDPFKFCTIDNFINDEQFLHDLVNFITNGPYELRKSDMFTYSQMPEEIFMSNPLIQRLTTSLVQDVIPFLSKVTGKALNRSKVTLSASRYQYTDHLLCHDDMSEDRKIAFIIYLNRKWERSWGGTLDFFRRDYLNDPGLITASLVPEFNRFLFFEVSAFSFHQVAEVIEPSACRYTINGWFHYARPVMQRGIFEPALCQIRPQSVYVLEEDFERLINPRWLEPKHEQSKKAMFEKRGHERLGAFFKKPIYTRILSELRSFDGWVEIGPPNRRRYEIIPETRLQGYLKEICRHMISDSMFRFIWRYTGRLVHPIAVTKKMKEAGEELPKVGFVGKLTDVVNICKPTSEDEEEDEDEKKLGDPRCSILIRRWRSGFYTTALDDEVELVSARGRLTDVCIIIGHTTDTPPFEGGQTSYINKSTGEEKHSCHPTDRNNTLLINDLSDEFYRYTKYINCKSTGTFYDIVMMFKE